MSNNKICISYSLATRLISTFGLTISILMINILASDFFSKAEHDQFSATVESWALFGLNWTFIVKNAQSYKQAEALLICVLLYAGCCLIANALLSVASLSRKPQLTLPWMYIQVINIIDQSIALALHLSYSNFNTYNKSTWYMPISSFYLLMSIYFLKIVCAARKEWTNFPQEITDDFYISTITTSYRVSPGFNLPKSPSYLADQAYFMESPQPMISSKYTQI